MRKAKAFGWRSALIGGAVMLCVASGASATVTVLDDGATGRPARILVQSAIRRGDLDALESALDRVSRSTATRINDAPFVTVELNSPGGDVVEALGMGRAISRRLAMTLVRPGKECVSACVFVLVAGAVHTAADGAAVGVHRPLLVSWNNISAAEAHARYDGLMAYLRDYFLELGVAPAAYDMMMGVGSADMRYFSGDELDRLRLRGEGPEWERYFAARQAARAEITPAEIMRALPRIPKIDEAWRNIMFMPGAYHPGADYYAGIDTTPAHIAWRIPADDPPPTADGAPDIDGLLDSIVALIEQRLAPAWPLLALLAFELVRGRLPIRPSRDQWRLAPFRLRDVGTRSLPSLAENR